MNYLLVEYEDNYADEFDISGFIVTDRGHWDEFITRVATYFATHDSVYHQFGSNEEIEYNSISEVLENFTTKSISKQDFERLQFMLSSDYSAPDYGLYFQKGHFPDFLEFCWEESIENN